MLQKINKDTEKNKKRYNKNCFGAKRQVQFFRKADMTIQIVVLAALALIFFIVVVYIMGGKLALFSGELSSCENKGGECVDAGTVSSYGTATAFTCPENQECRLNTCIGKGGSCEAECTGEQLYFAACKESSEVCCK